MRNRFRILFLVIFMLLSAATTWADQVKIYVTQFAVSGATNKEEIKSALQTLLVSRLSGDGILAVDGAENAEVIISGSYIAFGKVFSIDATAKSRAGSVVIRSFEQGENQEEMLQAVGKIANSLKAGIDKSYQRNIQTGSMPTATVPGPSPAVIRPEPVSIATDIIKSENTKSTTTSAWISQKLEGELVGIASGRRMAEKGRELFVAGKNKLQFYLLDKEMTLQAEVSLPISQKILGIDTADLDGDGISEIYLTVMNNDDLFSQVWLAEGKSLRKVSDRLPYFFRAITSRGQKKLYAQQTGQDSDYYGDLLEVTKKGASLEFIKPVKLPAGYNIYNINMINTDQGKTGFVVLNPDGYLVVFDEKRKDIWKSGEKYGGSESYFSRDDLQNVRVTGNPLKRIFLEQRLTVAKSGEIIVPKNDGFFVIGDSRSYTKNFVYAFKWNGASLEELWHTKQSQNYLADYIYDEEMKELLLLEVVKKAGILEKGASVISIKKVE